MYKTGFLILLAFSIQVISLSVAAQGEDNRAFDSLLAIANKPKADTGNVTALIEIARLYLEKGKYDSVRWYGEKSFDLASTIEDKKGMGISCFYIGYGFGAYGKYDSTVIYFARAEKIMLEIKDTSNLVTLYNGYGILNNFQSDYSTAIFYLLKAADLLKNSNTAYFRRKQTEIYGNLGVNLVAENQLEKGIDYQKKALAIAALNEYPAALRYRTLFYAYIAEAYTKLKKFKEAWLYIDSAKTSVVLLKNPDIQTFIVNTEAFYYQSNNEPQKALAAYLKALALTEDTRIEKQKAEVAGNIAKLYMEEKNNAAAEKYASLAATLGLKLRLLKVTAGAYEVLKKVAADRNDFKNAFHYAELQKLYADSATNSETQKTTLSLEARYQGKKKETEIAGLTISNTEKQLAIVKRNRLLINGGLTAAALLLVTGLLYRGSRQKQVIAQKEQKLNEEHIKFLERQQQVISLQSMVNGQETERTRIAKDLHDGLGGLFSTIKMHFSTLEHERKELKADPLFVKSYEMVNTASEELRRIAHNMMPEVLLKMGLIQAVQELCNSISAGKLLNVSMMSYGMDTRLGGSTEIMLFRIIQELLNNIIKHANATEAIIQFNRAENRLTVTVEDNGCGFDLLDKDEKKHAGLSSVESRVSYLNGKISIESQKEIGTTVMMDFLINER